jgi:hypothetical protein
VNERWGTFAAGVILLLLAILLLNRCGGGDTDRVGAVRNGSGPAEATPITPAPDDEFTTAPAASNRPTQPADTRVLPPATPRPRATTAPAPTRTPARAARTQPARGGVTVDGDPLFPLSRADHVGDDGDLSGLRGRRAVAWDARVLSVPADEGFWIGTGGGNRVWVQLTGPPPESPYTVLPGDTVSFTARFVPNGRRFAARVGVDAAEGSGRLTRQGQHLDVTKRTLSLFHRP